MRHRMLVRCWNPSNMGVSNTFARVCLVFRWSVELLFPVVNRKRCESSNQSTCAAFLLSFLWATAVVCFLWISSESLEHVANQDSNTLVTRDTLLNESLSSPTFASLLRCSFCCVCCHHFQCLHWHIGKWLAQHVLCHSLAARITNEQKLNT